MISIRKSLGTGIFYTTLARYSGILISIVIGAILARLLSPEEFGTVALVTVFVNFFNLFSDFGIGPAIVQNQTLSKKEIESIFSFSILIAFFMALLFFSGASLISRFYNKAELVNVSRYLALSILFYSLQIVPKALIQKDLKFKQLGIVTLVVQTICGALAIVLAYAGLSYYALVIQSIISGFFLFIIFYWISPVKVALNIDLLGIKKIFKFSAFQFMFNVINYFSRNADNILIGKFMNSSALGYYDKSYRLMMMPVANLTHVITPVLMPVLSRFQNDKELVFKTYLKVIKILSIIGFPLSVFLFFSANEIILLMYGSQWGQSIPVFKLLAATVGFQMILSSSGSIFQTVNRTDLMFITGVLGTIVLVGGISYSIFFINASIVAVSWAVAAGYLVYFFIIFYFLIKKALKRKLSIFFKVLLYPLFISGVMGTVLWFLEKVWPSSLIYSLICKLFVSGGIFLTLILSVKDNRMLLKRELNRYLYRKSD